VRVDPWQHCAAGSPVFGPDLVVRSPGEIHKCPVHPLFHPVSRRSRSAWGLRAWALRLGPALVLALMKFPSFFAIHFFSQA
jgi:hypothetical protein